MRVANSSKLYLIFIGVVSLIIIGVIGLIIYSAFSPQTAGPSQGAIEPTPTSVPTSFSYSKQQGIPVSPLEKTTINQTTDTQVKKTFDVLKTDALANGVTRYTVKSDLPTYEDQVYTKGGVVIFDSTSIFTIKYGDLPLLTQYEEILGQPEATYERNLEYGWAISNYLFASKGYLLVANKFTKEVYEVDRFTPMTVTQFVSLYGADYLKQAPPPSQSGN